MQSKFMSKLLDIGRIFASCVGFSVVLTVLAGCASDAPMRAGRESVKQTQAVQANQGVNQGVNMGRVETVRAVGMDDAKRGNRAPAGAAAVSGSLAQTMTGMLSSQREGVEVVVHLDDGAEMTVVQAADVAFRAGDRVRVMQGHDGVMRVTY
jgi:outer membrane lipoprotein SlyB